MGRKKGSKNKKTSNLRKKSSSKKSTSSNKFSNDVRTNSNTDVEIQAQNLDISNFNYSADGELNNEIGLNIGGFSTEPVKSMTIDITNAGGLVIDKVDLDGDISQTLIGLYGINVNQFSTDTTQFD